MTEETLVTWKSKEVRDGIEVNDEHEFSVGNGKINDKVPDHQTFCDLLRILGLQPGLIKQKRGRLFRAPSGDQIINAELCEVPPLGWFLELEIILNTDNEKTVQETRERLLTFLDKCAIGRDKIEERYYSEMLRS